MKYEGKRIVQYAGNAVSLEFDDPATEEILDAIIYPFSSPATTDPSSFFRIEINKEPDQAFLLFLDGKRIYKSKNKIDFAEMLLSKVCYQLAFDSQGGMLFHAAGLGFIDQGILIPGGIGFGKSTFTAWMVTQGCDYFSDEFVYFPWETDDMHAFYRPLHLKKPSRKVLDNSINYDADNGLIMDGSHSDLIHPTLIRPANRFYQPAVRLILFPHYQADCDLEWQELTPGQTGLELMQFLINARNLRAHGFEEIARLARKTKAIKFAYTSFQQIEKPIQELLRQIRLDAQPEVDVKVGDHMGDKKLSKNALRVQTALAAFGLDLEVVELPDSTRTAPEAAAAVGCTVEQIVKSLIFRTNSGEPVLITASGGNRVNEKRIREIIGEKIARADADFVREVTGYPIGGVPPFAHDQKIETIIDEDLLQYDEIWAAAGTPNAVFRLEPQQLVMITGGRIEKTT